MLRLTKEAHLFHSLLSHIYNFIIKMKTHKMVHLHITCEVLLASITMGRTVSTRYIQEPKARLEMHRPAQNRGFLFLFLEKEICSALMLVVLLLISHQSVSQSFITDEVKEVQAVPLQTQWSSHLTRSPTFCLKICPNNKNTYN